MSTSRYETRTAVTMLDRIAELDRLDGLADRAQSIATKVAETLGRPAINALHGTWLGHPLHPVLTDVPLGAWSATFIFDLMEPSSGPRARLGGDISLAVGLAGAFGAILTGWNDWRHTSGRARRLGVVHGLLNGAATLLYSGSLIGRMTGARSHGRTLSMVGFGISSASAYLGGALVYGEGIGVDHARGVSAPPDFRRVMLEADLPDGTPRRVELDGSRLLLYRRGESVSVIAETCAHLGGPLSEGSVSDDIVTCPWHGSRFSLRTGQVIDGPSVFSQPCFEARARSGWIEVRTPPS
ncbi:MAG: Rieske 2Fe-2S domain-containing protein [Chloroflexota bacterium]